MGTYSFTKFDPIGSESCREIARNGGHWTIQGHSRSPILLSIESPYVTSSSDWMILMYFLPRTVCQLSRRIGEIVACNRGCLYLTSPFGVNPRTLDSENSPQKLEIMPLSSAAQHISMYQTVYAVVTCEIKLIQNYFSLSRCPSAIILFQRMETCLKSVQNSFRGLLQLTKMFHNVQCRWNNLEIISENFVSGWNNYISVSDVVTCETKHWNVCEIISVFYFTCHHRHWLYTWNKTLK